MPKARAIWLGRGPDACRPWKLTVRRAAPVTRPSGLGTIARWEERDESSNRAAGFRSHQGRLPLEAGRALGALSQSKSGLTSAPRLPHAWVVSQFEIDDKLGKA
jgi:hypothetical protein